MGGSRPRYQTAQGLTSRNLRPHFVIYGLGFTGQSLARRLLIRGVDVYALVRNPERFRALETSGLRLAPFGGSVPVGGRVFHGIPPLPEAENQRIRKEIEASGPVRIVYISSTGVYGALRDIGADTPAEPNDERGRRRLEEEDWILNGAWSSLVLRAAAIYGPGRGVHTAVREGRIPRGAGSAVVSRIHVEDLAAIAEAGLISEVSGVFPVADDRPCASSEIAECVRRILKISQDNGFQSTFSVNGRKVDGRRILDVLGLELVYPDWRSGVLASLAVEKSGAQPIRQPRRPPG